MRELDRVQAIALVAGIVALAISGIGALIDPNEFFRSYLLGYLFWISLALGSVSIALLHNLVGGRWGAAIRQFLESAARTVPLMAILVIPLFIGIPALYEWAHRDVVAHDQVLQEKAGYLNVPFFIVRTLLYFAIWIGLAWIQRRDRPGFRWLSGPGLILFFFTTTFAAIDWIMSLEPHWYSTIYGAIFVVGQALETFAFCIALLALFHRREPFAGRIDAPLFHDLGNLLLAFTCLWAYTSFSQLLIIWYGNIPEETPWYIERTRAGWLAVSVLLAVFHFAVPFAILLSRHVKRRARYLAWVAGLIIVMRMVDLLYWVEPSFPRIRLELLWMRPMAAIGLGGIWIAAFIWFLKRTPLLDIHDARLTIPGGH
jgi:hypothetical protein